jgi:hypothetical protein
MEAGNDAIETCSDALRQAYELQTQIRKLAADVDELKKQQRLAEDSRRVTIERRRSMDKRLRKLERATDTP